jgi:multidrug transporter EmrE-like cation transporter
MISQSFLILIVPILAAAGQICFKKGVLGLGDLTFSLSGIFYLIPRIFQNIWLTAGIFLFGFGFLLYLFALSKLQLNIAYPIMVSAQILLIVLYSWFFFKAPLSSVQFLGIVAMIFGIFFLMPKG